jgi:hypothetical protein
LKDFGELDGLIEIQHDSDPLKRKKARSSDRASTSAKPSRATGSSKGAGRKSSTNNRSRKDKTEVYERVDNLNSSSEGKVNE